VAIRFADDGPGISIDLRDQVIKPFERGAVSVDDTGGFGMGLAVASRIAQHHDGEINISDSEHLGGAEVTVSLKRSLAAS